MLLLVLKAITTLINRVNHEKVRSYLVQKKLCEAGRFPATRLRISTGRFLDYVLKASEQFL
jgi:hypothetical protein